MLIHLKKLFKSSAVYGFGTALNQMLSILILPLFTSHLTPEDYGVSSVLTVISLFLISLFSLGLGSSIGIVYYDYSQDNTRGRVIGNSLYLLLPCCFFLFFLCFKSSLISLIIFQSTKYSNLIFLTILTVIISLFTIPLSLNLQFEEKNLAFVLISIVCNIYTLALSVFLIVYLNMGVMGRIIAYTTGSGLNFLLIFSYLFKKINYKFDFSIIKLLFLNGIIFIPSFFSLYILQQGNVFLLKELTSLTDVGLYSIGNTFGSSLALFVNSFMMAWVPFALNLKDKPQEASELFGQILIYYLLSIGSLSLCLYALAKPLLIIFTNSVYYSSHKIIGLSSTVQLLLGLFSILSIESYMAKQNKFSVIAQIISTLFFIPASILLIIWFKGIGAIFSLVLSYFVMIFLILYFNNKNNNREIKIKLYKNRIFSYFFSYFLFVFLFNFVDFGYEWWAIQVDLLFFFIYFLFVFLFILKEYEKKYILKKIYALIKK